MWRAANCPSEEGEDVETRVTDGRITSDKKRLDVGEYQECHRNGSFKNILRLFHALDRAVKNRKMASNQATMTLTQCSTAVDLMSNSHINKTEYELQSDSFLCS